MRQLCRIQRFGRKIYWRRGLVWRRYVKRTQKSALDALYLKKFVNKLTRDKETYWL